LDSTGEITRVTRRIPPHPFVRMQFCHATTSSFTEETVLISGLGWLVLVEATTLYTPRHNRKSLKLMGSGFDPGIRIGSFSVPLKAHYRGYYSRVCGVCKLLNQLYLERKVNPYRKPRTEAMRGTGKLECKPTLPYCPSKLGPCRGG